MKVEVQKEIKSKFEFPQGKQEITVNFDEPDNGQNSS